MCSPETAFLKPKGIAKAVFNYRPDIHPDVQPTI